MKFKALVVLLSIIIISCTDNSNSGNGVRITGKLENPAGEYVFIQELQKGGFKNVDSASISAEGNFELNLPVENDGFYRLNLSNRQFINLILDGEEDLVKVTADGSSPQAEYSVEGAPHSDMIRAMDSLARLKQSDIQMLNNEALAAKQQNNAKVIEDIREQYYYLVDKYDKMMKQEILDAAPSLAGIYGINYLELEGDMEFAEKVADIYEGELPDNFLVQDLLTEVKNYKKLAVGSPAPEISLPTPDGDELSLSSLRGNYVLIDFWAAWCRPCRMENPNVVRLYNKYGNENFEILGVSLDRKREDWLRAIEQDGLTWKHVSDLKYFSSEAAREYNINAIPATYLIGPDGNIIAKGLRGSALEQKLQELFGA